MSNARTEEPLVSIRDLNIIFGIGDAVTRAVDNVSLDIDKGELTFIFGASGCGKTTLLNAIGGMTTPTSGTVLFEGRDISNMSRRQQTYFRRNSVGFIFQHYNLISGLTAAENVAVSASLVPGSMDPVDSLARVGLQDKATSYPFELSGGQQQRVCVARALCKHAPLILADEPTGALDVTSARTVMELLADIVHTDGATVVMVTHNPDLAPMADRVITMSDGKVVSDIRNEHPLPAAQCI